MMPLNGCFVMYDENTKHSCVVTFGEKAHLVAENLNKFGFQILVELNYKSKSVDFL